MSTEKDMLSEYTLNDEDIEQSNRNITAAKEQITDISQVEKTIGETTGTAGAKEDLKDNIKANEEAALRLHRRNSDIADALLNKDK